MNHVSMNPAALYPSPPALLATKPRWPMLSRLTPAGLSILVHSLFFIYFGASFFDDGGKPLKHGTISVHLQSAPAPTPAKLPEKPQAKSLPPSPRPAPVKSASPTTLSSAKSPLAIPPTSPMEISAAQPEPHTETPSEPQEEIPEATLPATTVVENTPALPTSEQRQQAKQHYLATLMTHIESHKHYPRTARQRRMEGQTTVQFTLLASGEICEINISNGPRLLRIASKAALQKALPLPKPPSTLDFPLPIQFDMEYRLI